MNVGAAIKNYINDTGRTQAYVSKKTGIPRTQLTQSLNGKRKITIEEYSSICKALEVDPEKFLSEETA